MRWVVARFAEMAELADAHGSGPCDSNIMRVQVPFSAVYTKRIMPKGMVLFVYSRRLLEPGFKVSPAGSVGSQHVVHRTTLTPFSAEMQKGLEEGLGE